MAERITCEQIADASHNGVIAIDAAGRVAYANVRDISYMTQLRDVRSHFPIDDGFVFSAPVGSYLPNGFGFHDMHGNLHEWCRDSWLDPLADRRLRRGDGVVIVDIISPYRSTRGGGYTWPNFVQYGSGIPSRESFNAAKIELGVRPGRRVDLQM